MTEAGSAERRIYALAAHHGIEVDRLPIDEWADQVARLSDANVPPDPVMDLVVTLQRKGIVTDREAADLYGDYIRESEPVVAVDDVPISDRLARSLALARELGPFAAGDHKRETDEMWGEQDGNAIQVRHSSFELQGWSRRFHQPVLFVWEIDFCCRYVRSRFPSPQRCGWRDGSNAGRFLRWLVLRLCRRCVSWDHAEAMTRKAAGKSY